MDVKERGMQKKMILVIAAVAAVAIVTLALILALGRKEETYRSIKIIELEGGVTIEREGVGTLAASSNMNLISGDAVKTEQDAYAVLQLDADKYVMLAESGSMTVVAEGDAANSRTAIRLDSGSVLSEIQNPLSDGSSYDIVTPNATMSVRGTVFEVRKNGDDSTGNIEVLVYDGKVEVDLNHTASALYEAGEYTQFTAGQDPQFTVERTEIAEEHLNPQIMERLEQIDSQSRELNLGTAQLASAQTRNEAEPKQTPAVTEPVTTPAQTEAPATPAPSATPAATPEPAKTPVAQAAVQTPAVTAPVETPVIEVPEPDEEDEEDWPVQPAQPTENPNQNNNGNYSGDQDFWKTYSITEYRAAVSKYQQSVSGGNAGASECRVIFYLPYIVNVAGEKSVMQTNSPAVHASVKVAAGSSLTSIVEPPKGYVNYSQDMPLTFDHWCLEDGTQWNATDMVIADMCLYPVWKDEAGTFYYPVILRSANDWGYYYYCNSVKSGSYLEEITLSGGAFKGWKTVSDKDEPDFIWKFATKVDKAISLQAVWE